MNGYIDFRKVRKPLPFINLIVEIGFGSGDYLIKMASENIDKIFFGIEKSWISIFKLIRKIKQRGLSNIYCSRIDAYWGFFLLFRDQSIQKIIINYPDPWFKKSHIGRRLTKRQNLYIYAKKLISSGEIRIRTDDYQFLEFTLAEALELDCFSVSVINPQIQEPMTKYEKKWLSQGKIIYDLVLIKKKEPEPIAIYEIREVEELFSEKFQIKDFDINKLNNKEYKIKEGLHIRFFSVWEKDSNFAIETLLSENGFVQRFLIVLKKKNNFYFVDVSPFSEVLKTEGIQEALKFVRDLLNENTSEWRQFS